MPQMPQNATLSQPIFPMSRALLTGKQKEGNRKKKKKKQL